MDDGIADLATGVLEAQKEFERLGSRLLLLQKRWTRKDNLGPAFTLAEFARVWCIPERTLRHYAKQGPLPGGFRVGKRLKIRRTRQSFEFGKSLLAKQQGRHTNRVFSNNAGFLNFAVGVIIDTERTLSLQSAHTQNPPETCGQESDVIDILSKRMKALEGLENPSQEAVFTRLEEQCPDDPVAKMTEAERSVRQNHRGVFGWVSVAAALNQNGIRPTRERIAERLGMSRATFTRKFPEARWSVIKAAVSDWMNNNQPVEGTAKKNRKKIYQSP